MNHDDYTVNLEQQHAEVSRLLAESIHHLRVAGEDNSRLRAALLVLSNYSCTCGAHYRRGECPRCAARAALEYK